MGWLAGGPPSTPRRSRRTRRTRRTQRRILCLEILEDRRVLSAAASVICRNIDFTPLVSKQRGHPPSISCP